MLLICVLCFLNANNVTDMCFMFFKCSSLEVLNISNFNTENVSDMSNMFYGCSSLKELNLSNFNTKRVINMKSMFYGCSAELIFKIRSQYNNFKENVFDYL